MRFILEKLWRKSLSFPPSESFIHLRSGYYSELPRYRDQKLTYRQIKAAFEGMIKCRFIEITSEGSHFKKLLTGFVATDQLSEILENLEGHPAFVLSPPQDKETITTYAIFWGTVLTKLVSDLHCFTVDNFSCSDI